MLVKLIDKKNSKKVLAFECVYFDTDGETLYIKRMNGAKKETVDIAGKKVYINNFELK